MKKLAVIVLSGILFSCNNTEASKETMKDSTNNPVAEVTLNYPYTIEHPDYWVMGSNENTLVALNGLKKWEEGKMDESMQYFGDSVRVQFDGLDKKMSKDSLKLMLTGAWNNYKNVTIRMYDWESVISKDKAEEWVTLWYTQSWETKPGSKDSVSLVNDLQIKNGKIIRLSEYTRKLH